MKLHTTWKNLRKKQVDVHDHHGQENEALPKQELSKWLLKKINVNDCTKNAMKRENMIPDRISSRIKEPYMGRLNEGKSFKIVTNTQKRLIVNGPNNFKFKFYPYDLHNCNGFSSQLRFPAIVSFIGIEICSCTYFFSLNVQTESYLNCIIMIYPNFAISKELFNTTGVEIWSMLSPTFDQTS